MEQKTIIELKDGFKLRLKLDLVEEEIDLDRITSIDISNLAAEIVTIPVILNKFGVLLAEATSILQEKKAEFEYFIAKEKEKIRMKVLEGVDEEEEEEMLDLKKKSAIKKLPKKLTNDEIESKLLMLPIYMIKKKAIIAAEKNVAILNSAFWSIKDKSGKIDKLSSSITQGDVMDSLVGTALERMNCVDLKIVKPRF